VTPTDLAALIRAAATDVLNGRGLGADALPVEIDAEIDIIRPRNPAHGDYATSIALRTATRVGVPPRELAAWLADDLSARAAIATAEVAGPGFVNLRLVSAARGALVGEVLAAGASYGADPTAVAALTDRLAALDMSATLVDAIGVDAARYALIRSSADTAPAFDVALLASLTSDNPAYHVRYTHARLSALARHAADLGMPAGSRYELLEQPGEDELVRALGGYPFAVRVAAQRGQPHRVPRHLETVATACERVEADCRVLPMGDEPITELYRARLALALAARQVLANGLALLGVSAPERM
jgi:arginyl-tRNA synthetase